MGRGWSRPAPDCWRTPPGWGRSATLRLQSRLRRWLRQHPPDAVVLIDYMGANVNLGLRLRRHYPALPITYYIAPQEWAFRLGEGGTTRLIGFSDRILAIFPEEARFYGSRGARVTWVGHPLIDTLGTPPSRAEARRRLGIDAGIMTVGGGKQTYQQRRLLELQPGGGLAEKAAGGVFKAPAGAQVGPVQVAEQ